MVSYDIHNTPSRSILYEAPLDYFFSTNKKYKNAWLHYAVRNSVICTPRLNIIISSWGNTL